MGLSSYELFAAGEFFSDDDHITAPTYDDDKRWEENVKLETLLLFLRHIRENFPPISHFISEVTFSEENQHLKQNGLIQLLLIVQWQDSSRNYPRDICGPLKNHPPAEWVTSMKRPKIVREVYMTAPLNLQKIFFVLYQQDIDRVYVSVDHRKDLLFSQEYQHAHRSNACFQSFSTSSP